VICALSLPMLDGDGLLARIRSSAGPPAADTGADDRWRQ
jgi:hypothetical protein